MSILEEVVNPLIKIPNLALDVHHPWFNNLLTKKSFCQSDGQDPLHVLTYIARAQISPRLSGSFLGLALRIVVDGGNKNLSKKS